jgi:GH35 family endo-1,4-beta-xylanase
MQWNLLRVGMRGWVMLVVGLVVVGAGGLASAGPADDAALAAADAAIAANRKGQVKVKIPGVAAGLQANVSLQKLAFHWGAGVEGGPLNLDPSPADARFQAKVKENFNLVSTNGSAMWGVNEPTRGDVELGHLEWISDWAKANNFRTHLHTLLYDLTDPTWVRDLKGSAGTNTSAKESLVGAITDRTDYIFANPAIPFDEMQIYNESFSEGSGGPSSTYWNLFGAEGVAKFYHDARVAAARIGREPVIYSNDGWVLELNDDDYVRNYVAHIESIQGTVRGKVMDAMGLQFYTTGADANLPSRLAHNLDLLQEAGLPMSITEFGAYNGTTPAQAAASLDKTMRLLFGREAVTGMTIWDWINTNTTGGDSGQWAPYAALYTVTAPNYDDWQITPAGKIWQDRLGIKDWDGNPANAWTTQLTLPVAADGTISFNGYYGDYTITVDGKVYGLKLEKGKSDYTLGPPIGVAGDFNGDGQVDAADYTSWRDVGGSAQQYGWWRANFGTNFEAGGGAVSVPEPASGASAVGLVVIWVLGWRGRRRFEG